MEIYGSYFTWLTPGARVVWFTFYALFAPIALVLGARKAQEALIALGHTTPPASRRGRSCSMWVHKSASSPGGRPAGGPPSSPSNPSRPTTRCCGETSRSTDSRILKIDVEGEELEVLKGAQRLLPRIRDFILEVDGGDAEFRQVSDFLAGFGFTTRLGAWRIARATRP